MSRLLEYAGLPNVWEDLEGYVAHVGRAHPRIKTPMQLSQLVARATVERRQRHKWSRHIEFGADVLSHDIASSQAFQFFTPAAMDMFINMPMEQREKLIELPGLQHSYIWNYQNEFLQQVEEHDFRIIMSSPRAGLFRVPDIAGPFKEVRAYEGNGIGEFERIETASWEEGERVLAERRSRNYVQGATIPSRTEE